jgi:hypothetical protein
MCYPGSWGGEAVANSELLHAWDERQEGDIEAGDGQANPAPVSERRVRQQRRAFKQVKAVVSQGNAAGSWRETQRKRALREQQYVAVKNPVTLESSVSSSIPSASSSANGAESKHGMSSRCRIL